MTDQRHESASLADDTVSRTYREIAEERAPEHLDRAILAKAARAARPRYARSRAWTRPVAWAATIALTVAIVLELTRVPVPEQAPFDLDAPALGDAGAEAADEPAAAAIEAEAPASIAPGRSNDVMPKSPEKTSVMQKTSAPLAAEDERAERQRQAVTTPSRVQPAAAPADAADFEVKNEELLRRADEMAETQSPVPREETAAPVPTSRFQAGAFATAAEDCPDEVRRDPGEWFECIKKLEDAGLDARAEEQRRLLREAFPAFDMP